MVMRLTLDFAVARRGIVTVSTPFLKEALTSSSSMSSIGMRRSNLP